MRISADALRVSALVAAGVASGYLWKAALDPVATGRVAAPVFESVEPFVHPPVTIARPPAATQTVNRHRAPSKGQPAAVVRHVPRVTRVGSVSRPVTKPKPTKPTPAPGGQPKPQTPPPTVTPPSVAPAVTSGPAGQQAAAVTPTPASTPPSAGNDTGRGRDKKDGGSAGSPPASDADRNRPGWGHGDENHDHSGPPHGK